MRGSSRARQLTSQAPLVRCQESIVQKSIQHVRTGALASLAVAAVPAAAHAQTPAPSPTAPATAGVSGSTKEAAAPAVDRKIKLDGKRLDVRAGRAVKVRGRVVSPVADRALVRLQLRKEDGWATVDRGRTRPDGRFSLKDRRAGIGSMAARVVAPGKSTAKRAVRGLGRLNVYRYAHASWYGPGLYGNKLGCGGTLGAGTVGVANKSLPCGTKLTLRHGDKSVRVKVIDRGPYVAGREYDLTAATAQKLGFSGHGPLQVTR